MIYSKKIHTSKDFVLKVSVASEAGAESQILCHEGDTINHGQKIGIVYRSKYKVVFPFVKGFQLQLDHKNKKQWENGSKISKGEIITIKSLAFGKQTITVPFDGFIYIKDASVEILSDLVPSPVLSAVSGKVVSVNNRMVSIQTDMYKIKLAVVIGRLQYGNLFPIKDVYDLSVDAKGKIVFFNGFLSKDFLIECQTIGVQAVIGISVSADVLDTSFQDMTIASLEGFGSITTDLYDSLLAYRESLVLIHAETKTVFLGLNSYPDSEKADISIKACNMGDTVQIFEVEHYAASGSVISLNKGKIAIRLVSGSQCSVPIDNIIGIQK